MTLKSLLFSASMGLLLISCGEETNDDNSFEVNMRVNYYTVTCTGVAEGSCLLIQEGDMIGTDDWNYFYFENSIKGFNYQSGFIYDLKVKKTRIENPPADGSSIEYELIDVVSKSEVSS